MNYKIRAKDRKFKNLFVKILKIFKFTKINLNLSEKILLFGGAISILSLFLPWIDSIDPIIKIKNSFSSLVGGLGFIIFPFLMLIILNILFINKKQKIKHYLGLHFKDYYIPMILGVFNLILGMSAIIYISGIQTFVSEINQGKGIGLYITGTIIIIIGSIMQKIYFNKKNIKTYLNGINGTETKEIDSENNMKFPF